MILGGDYMAIKKNAKEKEVHHMAVSMAVVPLLKDEVAKSFLKSLNSSELQPYTDEQRRETDRKIEELIAKRYKRR